MAWLPCLSQQSAAFRFGSVVKQLKGAAEAPRRVAEVKACWTRFEWKLLAPTTDCWSLQAPKELCWLHRGALHSVGEWRSVSGRGRDMLGSGMCGRSQQGKGPSTKVPSCALGWRHSGAAQKKKKQRLLCTARWHQFHTVAMVLG